MSDELAAFISGALVMYLIVYARHLWVHRKQKPRLDAPTGHEPWVQPEPKVRR